MAESAALSRFDAALRELPVIAILRGITPEAAVEVVQALHDEGIRIAEVPLNSPRPFETIALLVRHFGSRMVLGAGTVTRVEQVRELAATGALLCVSPNTDPAVIREAIALGLVALPGYQTPSEAFAALAAGARHLKLFPAAGREADIAALRAVLPADAQLIAVGGATPANVAGYFAAGATALGVGSDLYKPGASAEQVRQRARVWVRACGAARDAPVVELCWNPIAMIGEGPVWRTADASLLWVDPVRSKLMRYAAAEQQGREVALDTAVSALVTTSDGKLLGCFENGLAEIDADTGEVRRGATAVLDAGCRFNDLTIDSHGGLWIGVMHKGLLAGRGSLYHAPGVDGPLRRVSTGLGVPNGMAFDAAERTLYLIDTLSRHLLAFPVDTTAGALGEPVIVTDFLGLPGKPDGMTMAPDGSLWVAMWGGGCVLRLAPNGAVERQIAVPAQHVSSLCFGAEGELWVSTSRMRLSEAQLAASSGAGALFRIHLR
ncbi:MAG TPA: 2-dehydro-3-deoxy-6-phosphogalactonate aldolase [Burkholderiaceae bacterium]|jgi:Entner-Doudoroff aldolase